MNDSSSESGDDLQKVQDRFLRAWQDGSRPSVRTFLDEATNVDPQELLQVLIPLDIEHRALAGDVVNYQLYESLGSCAANIAAAYFSIDQTPSPDDETRISADREHPGHTVDTNNRDSADEPYANKILNGKYKLLQQIGAGGMGAVWLAQQEQPVRRRVALKVIRNQLGSPETIARFEAERQALAMMNHPNIAQVLDAGTMDDGSPYFVMELVKGVPLTRYCNENRLSIDQRLELLVPVCHAIQHAHQKGIVHRDIKPSNILVSAEQNEPVPKVIDFGLAKALEHQHKLTDQTMLTEHGRVIGTLQYMSPEQAGSSELDVDARTDIYSLGVVLYQLLTGTTPLDRETVAKHTLIQIIDLICGSELQTPSNRLLQNQSDGSVVAKQRQTEPGRLAQSLQGELDWIAMKALEKDRTLRYQTASALADDLQRYLRNEPVLARPPSSSYLIKKFVKKHRGLVASVLLTTGLLVAGICTSTYFAIKSNRLNSRFENQLQVYKDLFANTNPLSGAQQNMTAIDILQKAETDVMQRFENDPIGQAAMLHEIGTSYWGQGRFDLAIETLKKALRLREQAFGENDLRTLNTKAELAISYQNSDLDEMLRLMNEVYAGRKTLLKADDPKMINTRHFLGTASFVAFKEKKKKGIVERELIDRARSIFEDNYRFQVESLGENHDDTLKTLTNLANVHLKNGEPKKSIEFGSKALQAYARKIESSNSDNEKQINQIRYLTTKNNYAEALLANSQPDRAIEVFLETLKSKADVYDLGHVSWRTTLRLVLDAMAANGKTDIARNLFDENFTTVEAADDLFEQDNILVELIEIKKKIHSDYELDGKWQPLQEKPQ